MPPKVVPALLPPTTRFTAEGAGVVQHQAARSLQTAEDGRGQCPEAERPDAAGVKSASANRRRVGQQQRAGGDERRARVGVRRRKHQRAAADFLHPAGAGKESRQSQDVALRVKDAIAPEHDRQAG